MTSLSGARGRRLIARPGLRVDVEEFEIPEPGPGQMLVRVKRSQISAGSELNGLRLLDEVGHGERGLGYTLVGVVERVGSAVAGFRPGDRVLAFGEHASHYIADLNDRTSWRSYPDRLPEEITDEQACFGTLGDVALHSVRRAALQIDESVVVLGAGVVGQLVIQFCRLSGAYPIIAVDLVPARLELARELGASHVIDASATDVPAGVMAHTGDSGAETVFHCSANPQILKTAMAAAAKRGTVVLTGSAPGPATIGLQEELLRRELTIVGTYESGLNEAHPYWPWTRQRNRAACFRLIVQGHLQVDSLVSHVVPPERAQEIYRTLAAGGEGWMSVLFDWE
jgi:threonine dehydrogenase-like Zn-dependent dehydrogenase